MHGKSVVFNVLPATTWSLNQKAEQGTDVLPAMNEIMSEQMECLKLAQLVAVLGSDKNGSGI